ncbi:MAG: HAMP domain-containing histidine kinase [Clostridia bacterium]|nr:HAMP domain-containing histidine kinase [Clostridia bacterium]
MIKKLRWKFVASNMLLVGIVVVAVIAFVTANQCVSTRRSLRDCMRSAMAAADPLADIGKRDLLDRQNSTETFGPVTYTPAVYAVTVSRSGVVLFEGNNSVTVDATVLAQVVSAILESGASEGEIPSANLFFTAETGAFDSVHIALADSLDYRTQISALILTGVLLAFVILLALFVVSFLLSNLFVRPVKRAWETQQTFLADASHELKTPLTVILANTDILAAHRDSTVAEQSQWVESTLEEAQSMKTLVDRLLYLSKADAGKLSPAIETVDLSEMAAGAALQFDPVAFESGVELVSDVADGIYVEGDREQLRRLVHILVDNAVKYAGRGGRAAVKLEKKDKNAVLTVHNTGDPIPAEDLPHVFERFYRSDKARTAGGGYGLGLAIAKTIADANRAKISVTSAEFAGTAFTVVFRQTV